MMRRTIISSLLLVVLSAGCAARSSQIEARSSRVPSSPPATVSPSPSPAESTTWLVVLRVAPSPAGVRDDADALASVLGGAIQVAPGSCYTGLPSRFGGDRYILGALGSSKAEVDTLAADAHIDPLFEGEVQVICID